MNIFNPVSPYIFSFVLLMLSSSLYSQDTLKNQDIVVTGFCTVNDIRNNPIMSQWFVPEYSSYVTDKSIISQIKEKEDINYTITLIMGSWCGDSKEQVPRFIKILDEAGFIYDNINMICVDRKKLAGEIDLSIYGLQKVPTIIVYIDEEEKGRIVETPAETLEKDLLNILNK